MNNKSYKEKIDVFINTIKHKLNISTPDYKEHILILLLEGFFGEENKEFVYPTIQVYENLPEELYEELFNYVETIDIST